ncbi:hypothetical protein HRI_004195300 [Hibiscus trionum]|uniref:Squamosa promoter-binding-like protein n=1 Tax=Hibiscus trionum TaxID=183268 RepID=A0A9W7MQ21_HIBTR|nr:hypothetical protein HRI_004195300 [Hibiscus trionum]
MEPYRFEKKGEWFEIENMNRDLMAEYVDNDMEEEEGEEEEEVVAVGYHGSGRRGPGGGGRVLPPCCQVENCGVDLSVAKQYYRRHKVCEVHSKAAVVVVSGIRQRFCQQCSRFHELSEFDEAKRSCRSRLAGHNERRRKSSAESSAERARNVIQRFV